ncbi:MAG: XRE family transcriptional regulator [Rickettsiales bacterium]|nr:MAG: XRE family transcriptional regulator [Rickettsiales bacterium]
MITIFQLRAARSGIGITLKDLSKITQIGYVTLSRIERGAVYDNCKIPVCILEKLIKFYNQCGVRFVDNNSVVIDFEQL